MAVVVTSRPIGAARATPSGGSGRSIAAGESRPLYDQIFTASGASSPGGLTTPTVREQDDRSEGEVSDSEEQQVPAGETNRRRWGRAPRQPGESSNDLSVIKALHDLLGVVTAGTVGIKGGGRLISNWRLQGRPVLDQGRN